MGRLFPVILFIVVFVQAGMAKINDTRLSGAIRFRNYDISNGLPGETVRAVFQDSQGLMWLSVEFKGLCSFDGKDFDLYSHLESDSTSLSSNIVECIAEDARGNLWIGTDKGISIKSRGLHLNSLNEFTHFTHKGDTTSIPDDNITTLHSTKDGRMLVGTSNGLALYLGNGRFSRIKLGDAKASFIWDIKRLNEKSLLIGTYNGLHVLGTDFKTREIGWVQKLNRGKRTVYSSCLDKRNNRLWLGTDKGVFVVDLLTEQMHHVNKYLTKDLPSIKADCMFSDSRDRIWIGTVADGVYMFSPDGTLYNPIQPKDFYHNGFKAFQIRDIYEDSQGLIWIATKNHGLYTHDNKMLTFGYMGENIGQIRLTENVITSVRQTNDNQLLIGTKKNGLNIIDLKTGRNEPMFNTGVYEGRIEALEIDKDGQAWVATYSGLIKLNPVTKEYEQLDHPFLLIRTLKIDSKGKFWIGASKGLYQLDRNDNTLKKMEVPGHPNFNGEISYIYESRDGTLYFATSDDGLLEYAEGMWKIYNEDQPNSDYRLVTNKIRSVAEDVDGNIWLGTRSHGLLLQKRSEGAFFQLQNKLSQKSIFSIVEGMPGELWMGTNNGIYKYQVNDQVLEHYGAKYGVQGEVFNNRAVFKSAEGLVYMGGNNGLNYFRPEDVQLQYFIPVISMKSLNVAGGNIQINENGSYYFDHETHLSFEFFLDDFSAAGKNTFEYKLSADGEWIPLGTGNLISLANLEPNEYQLIVRGRNSDHILSNEANVSFIIRPPWWASWWAKTIYFLLIMGVLILIYKALLFRNKKQHELAVLKLEKDQNEKLTQHKLRFFTNISHELRSPLTVMLPSAEKLIQSKFGEEVTRHGTAIMQNVKVLISLVEELMEFRNLEQEHPNLDYQEFYLVSQCHRLYSEFEPVARKRNIDYQINAPAVDMAVRADFKVIQKIIRNLLSNAFKFTEEGQRVGLTVILDQKQESGSNSAKGMLHIEVSDTGKGISEEGLTHIFDRYYRDEKHAPFSKGSGIGLDLVKGLAELHGGQVSVQSEEGVGSTFTVSIPLDVLNRVENKDISYPVETEANENPTHDFLGDANVLVVEDDPEIQRVIKEAFPEKYTVLFATNGEEGLKLANKTPQPNLIISDVMMPVMDGLEMCEKIKSQHKTSHIPVIILTARSTTEDQLEGIEKGADDYLTKPFVMNILTAKIENILMRQARLKNHFENELNISPKDPEVYNKEKELLARCTSIIQQKLDDQEFGVEELSQELGMSRTHLFRKLKYLIDQSPVELINAIRMKRAAQLLESGNFNSSEVAYKVGFSSPSSFSTTFKRHFGITPKQYANNHEIKYPSIKRAM